jgi:excisionase family DNA binding protein
MDNSKKIEKKEVLLKEFLTLDETADYLSVSKSVLYKMNSKKEIPYYKPGGKNIYFKKADLDNWVYGKKVNSVSEVEIEVDEYLCRTNKIQG